MNIYLALILASLVAAWALGMISRHLDAKNLSTRPPEEFRDIIDDEAYRRSQQYNLAKMRLESVDDTISTVISIIFIVAGGFAWADDTVRSFGFGPLVTGLLFFGLLGLLSMIPGLPFSVYRTFVLENRFGFNKTTPGTFVADRLKAVVLAAIIGGPLLAGILLFFRWAGPDAWLWCWGFTTLFSLAVTYVAPQWILPLFNRFTPLEQGELRQMLENYADSQGFELEGLYLMDGSKRSTKANAFFTGFGKKRRIALFDTLVERHTPGEITAVLAHEVGHAKLGHVRKMLVASVLKTGLMFWLLSFFLESPRLFEAFGVQQMSVHAGLVFFALLYTPVSTLLSLADGALSRKHEYQADAFAARTTGRPGELASALKRLSADSLSNLTPHPFTVWLQYSHPPVVKRVRALARHEAA